jgi:hypothetical protein
MHLSARSQEPPRTNQTLHNSAQIWMIPNGYNLIRRARSQSVQMISTTMSCPSECCPLLIARTRIQSELYQGLTMRILSARHSLVKVMSRCWQSPVMRRQNHIERKTSKIWTSPNGYNPTLRAKSQSVQMISTTMSCPSECCPLQIKRTRIQSVLYQVRTLQILVEQSLGVTEKHPSVRNLTPKPMHPLEQRTLQRAMHPSECYP